MNSKRQYLFRALLLSGAVALTAPVVVMAAPNNYTPACTQINNTAHVNYQVGGIPQGLAGAGVDSNTNSFYVGVKVDVLVQAVDLANVPVNPGSTGTTLTYRVTNNGNATQKYALSFIAEPDGTASPFSGSDIYNATNPALSAATIASLAPDANSLITFTADTLLAQTNGQVAVYTLKAQTQWVGTSADVTGATTSATGATIGVSAACIAAAGNSIDVVTADVDGDGAGTNDADKDGAHLASDAYQVAAATLTITKSSAVYWDPVNLLGSPKAIPGAVMTYTVTIANAAGGATATNVNVSDDLSAMIANLTFGNGVTGAPTTSFKDATHDCSAVAGRGIVVDGVCKTNVFAGADGASWNDGGDANGGVNKISATGLSVAGGASSVVKYQVTIK